MVREGKGGNDVVILISKIKKIIKKLKNSKIAMEMIEM